MEEKKKDGLAAYLLLVFVLTGAFAYGLIYPAVRRGGSVTALLTAYMFFPALSAVLARLLSREGFADHGLRPRVRGRLGYYALAWLGPGVLCAVGAGVYFLLCPGKLDLSGGYLRQIMEAQGNPYEAQTLPMGTLMAIQVAQGVALGPLLNLIPSLGEEWGWRQYLYPRLAKRLSPRGAMVLGGVIWGLWHAPITALGHNYGLGYPGFPWAGIGAMCLFCTAMGVLLWWLREKTGGIIAPALAHGGLNAVAAAGMIFTRDGGNPFVGPAPTGILGGLPILLLAALVLFRAGKGSNTNT